MSRYFGELASTAVLTPMPVFRAGFPPLPALISLDAPEPLRQIRHVHRDRDAAFGIGYGNSSGYGIDRHYVSLRSPGRFRVM